MSQAKFESDAERERLLDLDEVAERLACSRRTIARRVRAGEIPVVRIGRLVRVRPAALEAYIAGAEQAGAMS